MFLSTLLYIKNTIQLIFYKKIIMLIDLSTIEMIKLNSDNNVNFLKMAFILTYNSFLSQNEIIRRRMYGFTGYC